MATVSHLAIVWRFTYVSLVLKHIPAGKLSHEAMDGSLLMPQLPVNASEDASR
jgi:hypothetical protein